MKCKCGHNKLEHDMFCGCEHEFKNKAICQCYYYRPRPKPEPIPLGQWFPVARKVKQTCCQCGHHMYLWLRVRKGAIEMRVTP